MNIIAVDDEPLALKDLLRTLQSVRPNCTPTSFATPREALAYAEENSVDVAFIDIEMPGMSGLDLAKRLKELHPAVHIVFVTSYEKYAIDAFALHATGYLLKPVQAADLEREMTFMYGCDAHEAHVRIRTFGGFEAFVNGTPLTFKRSKTTELLALLVDRRGAGVTAREACAVLWEDRPHNASQRSYYQSLVADLRSTLAAQADHVLVKTWNNLSIDPNAVDCDCYRFLDGDPIAVNAYCGSYLPAYSWAEFSSGAFRSRFQNRP